MTPNPRPSERISVQPDPFRWAGTASWWNVTFSTADVAPSVIALRLRAARFPVPLLAPKTTYRWQVEACNLNGCTLGPVWTVTTR